MRNTKRVWLVVVTILLSEVSTGSLATPVTISYELVSFGAGHWRYDYDVTNVSLAQPVREFTIWFNHELFRSLALATPNPPAADWSELVVQPAPVLHDDGFYDALATSTGIVVGTHVPGFAVEFDWLGVGAPGPQRFDIVDPVAFQTRYSGFTVPEPMTLVLLAGVLALARRPRPR